jgi:hypothetical protein
MYGSPEGGQGWVGDAVHIERIESAGKWREHTEDEFISRISGAEDRAPVRRKRGKKRLTDDFTRGKKTNQIKMKWHSFSGKHLIGEAVLASLVELFMNFRFEE